jgi:lipid-A-disaccharide synthase
LISMQPDRAIATTTNSPTFAMVAGEASGDVLGGGLIVALRERFPAARFVGIGGPQMIAAGLDAWYPAHKLSVMGFVEVLGHLPELLAIRRDVRRRVLALRPDCFVGIDAPDFNLALERKLKRSGIRTVHYVSPSVWAWREGRAAKIARSADRVLCLFPMEPAIYARYGVDARFVGHPLADQFAIEPDQAQARRELGLSLKAPVLALLPGSRLGEIRRLGADFLAAASALRSEFPDLQVVAPMANAACHEAFSAFVSNNNITLTPMTPDKVDGNLRLLDGQARQAMIAADAILVASGTAALEAMLAKRPMVVAYRIAPWTYRIVSWLRLLKSTRYSLPNILAGRDLVPELMQDACTPHALAAALKPMLRERHADSEMIAAFVDLHRSLKGSGSNGAAIAIAELLSSG